MTDAPAAESIGVGPIDYVLIEFPGSEFNGQIAPNILELVDLSLIHISEPTRRH